MIGAERKGSGGSDRISSGKKRGGLRTLPFDVTSMEDLPSSDIVPSVSPRPSSPLSGEEYRDHQEILLGSRVRPRRARKAVRRSKSALDARPKLRLSESDPREPPVPRIERTSTRPPWTGRPRTRGRGRARQMSLPESSYLDSDRVIGLHQVSPDPEADSVVMTSFQRETSFSNSSRDHLGVRISTSPNIDTHESCDVCYGVSVPTPFDTNMNREQPNLADIPLVEFKSKRLKSPCDKEKQEGNDDGIKKTKAMLNEPSPFDTGSEVDDVPSSKTSTLEAPHRPRAMLLSASSTQKPSSVMPSLATDEQMLGSVIQTPNGSRKSSVCGGAEAAAHVTSNVTAHVTSDDSNPSSPRPSRPQNLTFDNLECDDKNDDPSAECSSKKKPKRESTAFFKLPGFLSKAEDKDTPSSLPHSQQSSIVGLDWLFSTDSDDSPSSGKQNTVKPVINAQCEGKLKQC